MNVHKYLVQSKAIWFDRVADIPLGLNGLYFLFAENGLDYIGESHCIHGRLSRENHPGYQPGHHIAVIRLDLDRKGRQSQEGKMISRFKPRLRYRKTRREYSPEEMEYIAAWLHQNKNGSFTLNVSVKSELALALAEALHSLKSQRTRMSISEVAVRAIIAYAQNAG